MRRLGDILQTSLERTALFTGLREWKVIDAWSVAAGGQAAAQSRAASFRNGVLVVWVSTSLWAVELSYRREKLLGALRELVPGVELRDLRLVVRHIPDERDDADPGDGDEPPAVELSREDEERIEEDVASVDDPALRERLRSLMRKDLSSRRAREAAGSALCPRCGAISGRSLLCPFCELDASLERMREASHILLTLPYLSMHDCAGMVPGLTAGEYDGVREKIIGELWADLQEIYARAPKDQPLKREERAKCRTFCMLQSGRALHDLDEEAMRHHLGEGLHALFSLSKEAE